MNRSLILTSFLILMSDCDCGPSHHWQAIKMHLTNKILCERLLNKSNYEFQDQQQDDMEALSIQ